MTNEELIAQAIKEVEEAGKIATSDAVECWMLGYYACEAEYADGWMEE